MSCTKEERLEAAGAVHRQLRSGDPISDEDLKKVSPLYADVLNFLTSINDRKFDLMTESLRSDYYMLERFIRARKDQIKRNSL